jgi:mannose-6-phosphate isomerase-like protein (cupin superfamily)
MKGSGTLLIEDTRFPFVEGAVLFVPAGKPHRFSDFTPRPHHLSHLLRSTRRRINPQT